MTLPEAPEYGTVDWVAWRRNGIGASEVPVILGLDPYKTEHELWAEKTGRVESTFTGNAKTRWGHRLERLGLRIWEEEHDETPAFSNVRALSLPEYPHLWATPDGLSDAEDGGTVGIEVKLTGAWQQPPERVRVQCLVQAGLADLERVDVVRLSFDDDPAIYRIERDEAAIADILAAAEGWYVKHVIGDVEPPLAEGEVPADGRQVALAADLHRVRKAQATLERQERAIRDDIIASVAGQGIISGPGFRIEVRRVRGATRTGWKEVGGHYRRLLAELGTTDTDLDLIAGLYETTGNPTTAVYPRWDEEETE